MQDEAKKYLFDMLSATQLIEEFVRGKTNEDFHRDSLFRSGVERQFQIIGEALYQLSKRFPEIAVQIPDQRRIIGFRHILVHGYDKVVDDVTWGIVEADIPNLVKRLRELIQE